ncbi:MAG: DegT/DnrJ/EryC1/StrS aminotransferase family protein [Planctomycetota bacterium]|nr:DegT/DnrJ/EryC1/StrS aminotransferase family protein [Planctomycetota bacterium]MDE2216522.1 DegT/DnrJ/EryC1/StrS aminotransferase family protein [Planctomycetota bacterium]
MYEKLIAMIPHSRPTIEESDVLAVSNILRSGNIAQQNTVKKFEQELAHYIGVKGGVATSSGTAALHLALLALDITKKDTVAMPSYVCTAVLNAVNYVGATPLLIDIDPDTFNLDVEDLKRKLTPRVKAVIVPHTFGLPADIEEIMAIGVPIIEDCAHSIGAAYKNKMVGSFGDISIFSFYATKMITTSEGGMVTSNSEKFLEKIRDLRDYDNKADYIIRYNYKMTDIQASLGLSQLKRLNQFIEIRRGIAQKYNAELKNLCSLPVNYRGDSRHIYYRYVIKLHRNGIESFLKLSKEKGINCERPIFKPLHRYLNLQGFNNTDSVWETAVSIPIYPTLPEENVKTIVEFIKNVIN